MKLFEFIAKPEFFLSDALEAIAKFVLTRLVKRLKSAPAEKTSEWAGRIQSAHRLFTNFEGLIISLVPLVFIFVLSVFTISLVGRDEDLYSLNSFAVIWIIVSIYVIYVDFRHDLVAEYTKNVHSIFEILPEECRCDRKEVLEEWSPLFLKIRRFSELSMLSIGTLMNGYGELAEAWLTNTQLWQTLKAI